jgi:predicted permease
MSALRRWLARLAGVFAGGRRERELAEELAAHLRMEIEERLARGESPAEARRQALLRSGGIDVAKELVRAQRGAPFLDHLGQDVRYACRTIRRNPGFASITVLSLALGIGANTAVFSMTDAVFFRTLPVASPDELVLFQWVGPPVRSSYDGSMRRGPAPDEVIGTSFPMPFFERFRASGSVLSGVFAFAPVEQLNVVDGAQAGIARGQLVTGDYYATLGVHAVRGRALVAADDRPGAEPVAVLTHAYWQHRFGGDPAVVGSQVSINGIATTIVGVTPPGFGGTLQVDEEADVTLPMSLVGSIRPGSGGELLDPNVWWVQILGRRGEGVTVERAEAGLGTLFRAALLDAGNDQPDTVEIANLPRLLLADGSRGPNDERRDYRLSLTLLTILAALILLIACANAANLLLTRAAVRRREIDMRLALGASRGRLVRQLLTESLLLALLAGAIGLLLAFWGKDLLLILRPSAPGLRLALDLRVLAVATWLSVATALLFGLAPAIRATRGRAGGGIRAASLTLRGPSRALVGRGLVVAQIAMSLVLLFGAALFLRTLHNLRSVDVGFEQDRLLLFRLDPRLSRYDADRVPDLYRALHRELGAVPGVSAVTFSRHGLLTGSRRSNGVAIVGRPGDEETRALINPVGPAFFETMRLRIVAGRPFDVRDDERRERVAIVNEAFARSRFDGESPIGHWIRSGDTEAAIVGVSADAKYYSVRQTAEATVYLPFLQHERGQASFALRTETDPPSVAASVRAAVHAIDPTLSIFELQTQRAAMEATLGEERLLATMSAAFGALALVLACIGVYGVLAYSTAQRTGEIGLRIALGASTPGILWLVTRRTAGLVVLGIAVGLVAGVQGAKIVASMLYGLTPTDPLSILGAAFLIATVAFAAAWVPANRARRVSPLVALRSD